MEPRDFPKIPPGVSQPYIDYFQDSPISRRGLKNRFGVRVMNGYCFALIQIGKNPPDTFGAGYSVPLELGTLPPYFRMIVDGIC